MAFIFKHLCSTYVKLQFSKIESCKTRQWLPHPRCYALPRPGLRIALGGLSTDRADLSKAKAQETAAVQGHLKA